MASIPQFYSKYSFSNDFSGFQYPLLIPQENCIDGIDDAIPSYATCLEDISFPMFLDNIIGLDDVFQQELNLPYSIPTPDNNVIYQLQDVCDEFGEECNGFVHQNFKPVADSTMGENRGIQGNLTLPVTEDNNHEVVRYSVEERKTRILRYLKKRHQRNFNKTIKYACRKSLADRRVRVRGRFARNNTKQCEDDEMVLMRKQDSDYSHIIDKNLKIYTDAVQIKHDEEEWLQEALANLIYSPQNC